MTMNPSMRQKVIFFKFKGIFSSTVLIPLDRPLIGLDPEK